MFACSQWPDLAKQLADTKAWVDFSQGIDIRIMTEPMAEALMRIRTKQIHFAWDRYEDKDVIVPKFRLFKDTTGIDYRKLGVYVLCNFNTTIEQDLERIYLLRDMGYSPYVMVYNKDKTRSTDTVRKLQRWCNSRRIFGTVKRFEDYV